MKKGFLIAILERYPKSRRGSRVVSVQQCSDRGLLLLVRRLLLYKLYPLSLPCHCPSAQITPGKVGSHPATVATAAMDRRGTAAIDKAERSQKSKCHSIYTQSRGSQIRALLSRYLSSIGFWVTTGLAVSLEIHLGFHATQVWLMLHELLYP